MGCGASARLHVYTYVYIYRYIYMYTYIGVGFCTSYYFPSSAVVTRTLSCFGQGCTRKRMHSYQGRYHGSAMDALENVCTCNTNAIVVRPWMLSKSYALVPWLLSWFGHGCFRSENARALKQTITIHVYICIYIYIFFHIWPHRHSKD